MPLQQRREIRAKAKARKARAKESVAKRVYVASMATTALKKMEETHWHGPRNSGQMTELKMRARFMTKMR